MVQQQKSNGAEENLNAVRKVAHWAILIGGSVLAAVFIR